VERILSKEEIAELLSAVREGQVETEVAPEPFPEERDVKRLDLSQAHRYGRRRFGNFDLILDAFARNCGISITNRLQRSVNIQRVLIEPKQFDPFLAGFQQHSAIGIVRLDPLKYSGLFIFDGSMSFFFVETMLGGAIGATPLMPARSLTPIEVNVIRSIMVTACLDLQKAFQPLVKLEASLLRIEIDPRLVNILPPDAEIMVVSYSISAENLPTAMFHLVLPYASLEPLRDKMKESFVDISSTRTTSWVHILKESLLEMELEMTAQSGEILLPIGQIVNMKEGDVVYLGYDPNTPLRVLVVGQPKFNAQAGIHKGRKAVRITTRIE